MITKQCLTRAYAEIVASIAARHGYKSIEITQHGTMWLVTYRKGQ